MFILGDVFFKVELPFNRALLNAAVYLWSRLRGLPSTMAASFLHPSPVHWVKQHC